jgi:hypothetical protein
VDSTGHIRIITGHIRKCIVETGHIRNN